MRNKTKLTLLGVLISFLLATYVVISFIHDNTGINITLTNQTNETIKGLSVQLKQLNSSEVLETIEEIDVNKTLKKRVSTADIRGEASILLVYEDANGNKKEEALAGYIEGGYSGKVKLKILDIDEDGNLQAEVNSTINLTPFGI